MSEETLMELAKRQAETEAALCSVEILARGIRRDPDANFGDNTCNIIEGMTRIIRRCYKAEAEASQQHLEATRKTDWRKRQSAAHAAVATAIASGLLARPERCEKCGALDFNLVAHHFSYAKDKRLDVKFWCRPCHSEWHSENGSVD